MTPYLGQLLLASFNFAPKGWFLCNGQTLAINSYTALFSLLGTTFGGNGTATFQLPNLQGRTPVGVGNAINYGEIAGEESHTLLSSEAPIHTHPLQAGAGANEAKPNGSILAGGGAAFFTGAANLTAMNSAILSQYGGSQPHENRQPYLVMNWCIAYSGIFPSRN
ncbi:MAG: phage tail protein [Terracidiphilus sp.]